MAAKRGGSREGAGRPALPDRQLRRHSMGKASDVEMKRIQFFAKKSGMSRAEYIRSCALQGISWDPEE